MKIIKKEAPTRLTLRLPRSLYEKLKKEAAKEGLSLNTYCIYRLSSKNGNRR